LLGPRILADRVDAGIGMKRVTSRSGTGAPPLPRRPSLPAEQAGHVFVDERGRRARSVRWLGRGMTAAAAVYIVMLVGGALGVSFVPKISLPHLTLPFLSPQASAPEPSPAPQTDGGTREPIPAGTRAAGTKAASRGTAQPASADGIAQPAMFVIPPVPAHDAGDAATTTPLAGTPSPTPGGPVAAPLPATTPGGQPTASPTPVESPTPDPSPTAAPGQQGRDNAAQHGNKDKTTPASGKGATT
jgi:hypothetical protein